MNKGPSTHSSNLTSCDSPCVHVVVLNWNGWEDTVACVKSLEKSSYSNLETLIVDNASVDNSVEMLRKSFPHLVILTSDRNLGFAGGNNLGIRYALEHGADYVFVLNNDTLVTDDCIPKLVAFAEGHPDAALIGPKICDVTTGRFLDLPMSRRVKLSTILLTKSPVKRLIDRTPIYRKYFYRGDMPAVVYSVHGSAMMLRASALREIGLFDERTFIYWEEFIVAEKLKTRNLLTYVVPDARLWHKGSSSISRIGVKKFMENVKSEKYFFTTYLRLPRLSLWTIYLVRLIGYSGRSLIDEDYRKNFPAFIRLLFTEQV